MMGQDLDPAMLVDAFLAGEAGGQNFNIAGAEGDVEALSGKNGIDHIGIAGVDEDCVGAGERERLAHP